MHRLNTCYNLSMRITYDSVADATYVYLKEDAKIKGTISINGCYIDIDMDGHVVGVEYLHCPVIEVDGVAVDLASFRGEMNKNLEDLTPLDVLAYIKELEEKLRVAVEALGLIAEEYYGSSISMNEARMALEKIKGEK